MRLQLDDERRVLVMGDASVHVNRQEWLLARELLATPGKIVTRTRMVHVLYGDDPDGGPLAVQRVVTVLIYYLRKRLLAIGADADISNVHGEGYRLNELVRT